MTPAGQTREPVECMAGGYELERTRLGKPHRRGDRACEIEADDAMSELGGGARRSAIYPPAEHESATDMRPESEHDQVSGDKLKLLVVRLHKRRDVGVVVHQ